MRRNDRLIDDSAVLRAFLAQENVLHLGLTDGQAPYVVPMSYGFDWPEDGKPTFYLHCAGEGLRLSLIRKNPRVCVEISKQLRIVPGPVPCSWTSKYKSVIAFGTAHILTDLSDKAAALRAVLRQSGYKDTAKFTSEMLTRVTALRIDVESMTGKSNLRPDEEDICICSSAPACWVFPVGMTGVPNPCHSWTGCCNQTAISCRSARKFSADCLRRAHPPKDAATAWSPVTVGT